MKYAPFLTPLPPSELGSNARCHWRQIAPAKRAYKANCCVTVPRELRNQYFDACTVHLTFYAQRRLIPDGCYRPLDRSNAIDSFKYGFDALQEMGVVRNDKVIKVGEVTLLRSKKLCKGKIGVEVVIEA